MWSRAELPTRLAWAAACCLVSACAGAGAAGGVNSVCPVRAGAAVTQIDVFDGDPADLAYLAPDDERKAPGTYTVKGIYDQGRYVTIRCHYGADSVDVKLADRVERCRFSGGDAHPALSCK
jgi:hypothetical protein